MTQAREGVMAIPDDLLPNGAGGLIAGAAAAIIGGTLWLRNFLSKSATDRAADTAQTTVIQMLNNQLVVEQQRAESFRKSLDEATLQISQLRREVSDLTDQIARLQAQITMFQGSKTP